MSLSSEKTVILQNCFGFFGKDTFLKNHGNRRCDKPGKSSRVLRVKPPNLGNIRRFRIFDFFVILFFMFSFSFFSDEKNGKIVEKFLL